MKRKLSVLLSIFLCVALCISTLGLAADSTGAGEPAATDAPEDAATTPSDGPEEVIYARLDASGDPQDAYAVVALTLTEDGTATHYGRYTAVSNLTDTSPIDYRSGIVTLEADAGRYYYQGTLRSAKMPWNIEISYTLNGSEIDPDELGGRSGELGVNINTSVNSGFDPYFTENYMLQISVTLDASLCENISTRNGTVASAGSDKTITFVVLPGGEGDVGFTADVTDFEMGGFTIAAVPYSMDSMMDMSELDGITSGIDQLTGAITQLTSGASAINDGAGALSENSATLTDASDQIESALRQIADGLQGYDLSSMTEGLDQLQQLPAAFTQVAAALSQAGDGLIELYGGYDQIAVGLHQAVDMIGEYLPGGGTGEGDEGDTGGGDGGNTGGGMDMIEMLAMANKIYQAGYNSGWSQAGGQGVPSAPTLTLDQLLAIIGGTGSGTSGNGGDTGGGDGTTTPNPIEMLRQAADGLITLNGYLYQAAEGMYTMSDEMMNAAIELSSGLEGMTDFDTSAITELQDGMLQLSDSYEQFNSGLKSYTDGVDQLSEGMNTYTSGMYALNSETQGIPDMIDELLGTGGDEDAEDGENADGEDGTGVVSFLDERNTDTASVQFVISTDGISAPEQPVEDQPEAESQGFFADLWDKIVALFT